MRLKKVFAPFLMSDVTRNNTAACVKSEVVGFLLKRNKDNPDFKGRMCTDVDATSPVCERTETSPVRKRYFALLRVSGSCSPRTNRYAEKLHLAVCLYTDAHARARSCTIMS